MGSPEKKEIEPFFLREFSAKQSVSTKGSNSPHRSKNIGPEVTPSGCIEASIQEESPVPVPEV
jgi:hypothetical protein